MEDKSVYHERQRLQLCLLHALNNLLQEQTAFCRADLDAIAEKLDGDDPTSKGRWAPLSAIFKSHHNKLTGNYDVAKFAGLWRSRHWASIRRIEGVWYNLDSDFASPRPFKNLGELTGFLDNAIAQGGELLSVIH